VVQVLANTMATANQVHILSRPEQVIWSTRLWRARLLKICILFQKKRFFEGKLESALKGGDLNPQSYIKKR